MADILMHLPGHDRHKFQQMMVEAECSAVLKRKGFHNKRCRFCNDSIDGHPALAVTSHDFHIGLHVCTKRECLFRAPETFIALREKYLKKFRENPPLWTPGDPLPHMEDLNL